MRLGVVAFREGDSRQATAAFVESLLVYRELKDHLGIAACLTGLGAVAASTGDCHQAARLFAAVNRLCEIEGLHQARSEQSLFDCGLEAARANGDKEAFDRAWSEGQALTCEEAIALASQMAFPA